MRPRDAYQMQGYTVVQANPDFLPDDIRWKLTHHDNGEEITRDNPLLEPDGTIDYGHPVWDFSESD